MAPTKPAKGKTSTKGKTGSKLGAKSSSKSKSAGAKPEGISKNRQKKLSLAKPGGAQKTKSRTSLDGRKKKRVYSEKELDIPALNGIIPAGIAKPKGQKIGKKFVDDPASMMAIMSVVNAEKEGRIESKIMRARQLEEIREAKRKEAEMRSDSKKADFEERKDKLKKGRRKSAPSGEKGGDEENEEPAKADKKGGKFKQRKRVSFG